MQHFVFPAFALVAPSEHFVPSFFISSLNDNPVMMNVIGNVLLLLAAFSKSLSMILVRRNKGNCLKPDKKDSECLAA